MKSLAIGRVRWIVAAGLAVSLAASSAAADSITDARIAVDTRTPGQVALRYDLEWTPDNARTEARIFLAEDLNVTEVTLGKKPIDATSGDAEGTLRAWTIPLPSKVEGGQTTSFSVRATLAAGNGRGLEIGKGSGALMPGAGWFPRTELQTETRTPHTVTFLLEDGATGVAAGDPRGGGIWQSDTCRPYAVWGDYVSETVSGQGGDGVVNFDVWRRDGNKKYTPDADFVARAVQGLTIGLGEPAGSGNWKLVDVASGAPRGAARTVFYDGSSAPPTGDAATVRDRDLVSAAAVTFWTDAMTWQGSLAAFFSHSMTHYIGDVTYTALRDDVDNRDFLEAVTVGDRRKAFLARKSADRPLEALVSCSPGAQELLATRGALAAHLMATSVTSRRPRWIVQLQRFRGRHENTPATAEAFRANLRDQTVEEVAPFLTTTDLPDYYIGEHGAQETKRKGLHSGMRYRVEVGNRGKIAAHTDVAVYDGRNRQMYKSRVELGPGETKSINFGEPTRVARIIIDPGHSLLQSDVSDEDVAAVGYKIDESNLDSYVPSFSFEVDAPGPRKVTNLSVDLDGASISGFNGWLVPYSTKHGPSGAALIGVGRVVLAPTGRHAPAWLEAMGRESLGHDLSKEMWIRFPLDVWKQIEPQLGEAVPISERQDVTHAQNWIYQFSFPTYFFERNLAQVPPAGSTVVVFTSGGGERMGYARVPYPDGTVLVRLWDHLHGETLWEERL
ncbi:MAG: hypothetical protein HKN12_00585 [Gemmatimonadetes bacterium]|nr:hypothetical protein [Gemmatimonadota bacterium]